MEFTKASLQEVSSKPSPSPQPVGSPIEVQINPASLRMQLQNNVDAGKAFSRPNTQYQGSSSSTLSFDLLFDTADEGDTENPVDVRTRTAQLERFLLPSTDSPKAVPPRVRFTYGTLSVVGVMTSMNQDFDFFTANGVPLRAKCAISIKEQKPEFDAKLTGPGSNTGAGATPPVPPGAGPAGGGVGAPVAPADRTGTALGGESASDFASRMGLDPRAWKDLASALPNPLSLEAGLQIDFSTSLSLDVGLGIEMGATAGTGGERGAVGSGAGLPTTPVPDRPPAQGAALTAAGGLTRAIDRDTAVRTTQAADASRTAFAAPTLTRAPAPGAPASPAGIVTPALTARAGGGPGSGDTAATTGGAGLPTAPGAATVTADPRAAAYGFGVPLRERRGVVRRATPGLVHHRSRSVIPATADGVPESDDPTVPLWQALPASPLAGRATTTPSGDATGTACGCGCGGGRR